MTEFLNFQNWKPYFAIKRAELLHRKTVKIIGNIQKVSFLPSIGE
ncbi:hypothetical protein I4200191B4_15580 [Pseudoflavonifractor gallinarum]